MHVAMIDVMKGGKRWLFNVEQIVMRTYMNPNNNL